MLLELGPVPADLVEGWTRFARRMVCELRLDPAELAPLAVPDLLGPWGDLIDQWARSAARAESFRWSSELDDEVAEFLLHGYERFLHSDALRDRATRSELTEHRGFSLHVAQAFVDGLGVEEGHAAYAEQVRGTLGPRLAG